MQSAVYFTPPIHGCVNGRKQERSHCFQEYWRSIYSLYLITIVQLVASSQCTSIYVAVGFRLKVVHRQIDRLLDLSVPS